MIDNASSGRIGEPSKPRQPVTGGAAAGAPPRLADSVSSRARAARSKAPPIRSDRMGGAAFCASSDGAACEAPGSPRASNTGAITPPDGLERRSTRWNDSRLVNVRVDALAIAWKAPAKRTFLQKLGALLDSGDLPTVAMPLDGTPLEWKRAGLRWIGRNADVTLVVEREDAGGSDGWHLVAEARAVFLATAGAMRALAVLRRLLGALSAGVQTAAQIRPQLHGGERLRRLDLCADVAGIDFDKEDAESWVGRFRKTVNFSRVAGRWRNMSARAVARALTTEGEERARAERRAADATKHRVYTVLTNGHWKHTGFAVGFGNPLAVRLYDKTEELRILHAETEKQRTEQEHWRRNGWDGEAKVWRLEAQLRGEILDQLEIRDPSVALGKLDEIWRYLWGAPRERRGWLRLADLDGATRRERAPIDPRWVTFQSAVFHERAAAPARRVHAPRGGADPATALGAVLSALGARGLLPLAVDQRDPALLARKDMKAFAELLGAELLNTYHLRRAAVAARFADCEKTLSVADVSIRAHHSGAVDVLSPRKPRKEPAMSLKIGQRLPALSDPNFNELAQQVIRQAVHREAGEPLEAMPLGAVCFHQAVDAGDVSLWLLPDGGCLAVTSEDRAFPVTPNDYARALARDLEQLEPWAGVA